MKLSLALVFLFLAHLAHSQIQDKVDFKHCGADIYVKPKERKISARYSIQFLTLKNADSIFLDAHNMSFNKIEVTKYSTHKNEKVKVRHSNEGDKLVVRGKFEKGESYTLDFEYEAKPKQTVYFLGWEDEIYGNEQVWTQGQGKYTSYWIPSLDDMNDKIEFDLKFILENDYPVFSNGKLIKQYTLPKSDAYVWQFNMEQPMSSYLVAFAIGNFDQLNLTSSSGVPIELFYEPKDSLKVEPTYRHTEQIFDFLEKEIGIPYPWQNYKQIPVQDFLYAGMENTGATIFSNTFMVDSIAFVDKNFVNVNAHEMAHQWFGNLVTEQSGKHHWLHEGFATYYAYLAEKEIFGEDYFYWKLLETAKALDNFSGDGNGEALTNASAGSLTFYEKGAWALVMLRNRVGENSFKEGIHNYLTKYAYQNVTISDFMWEMEKASGMKLSDFEELWLQESDFPFTVAQDFLRKRSPSINTYYHVQEQMEEEKVLAETIFNEEWDAYETKELKHQLMLNYGSSLSASFLGTLLSEEGIKVRQAIALSLEKTPKEIQKEFETLLLDKSYKTIESALYRLWTDFPHNRKNYLDRTKNIIGLPNKNVHLLWLTLALVSPDYEIDMKPKYFEELNGYTGTEYHFEVRLLAFQYLKNIGAFNDATLKNLIKSCSHHVWHFKKSSRKMLKEFLKGEGNLARIEALYPTLNLEHQQYLDKTLGR